MGVKAAVEMGMTISKCATDSMMLKMALDGNTFELAGL
jgi:hypothetical protein